MNKQFLRFIFFLLMCFTLPLTVTAQVINIPDSNLRAEIEKALGKAPGATITVADMATLPRLEAQNANISDLTGLEGATNLMHLILSDEYVEAENRHVNSNSVSDLSPLSGLTSLTELALQRNNISDISALAELTHLRWLSLGNNNVTDISPLAGLTNLTGLDLQHNNISNISPVAGLTNLTFLRLDNNNTTDISPLAGLTNLETLDLDRNALSNISALAGLTHLRWLSLGNNNVTDISPLAGLTNLTGLDLQHNNISNISPVAELTHLRWLSLGNNNVTDISPLAGLTNLTGLDLQHNNISNISPVAGLTNLTFLRLDNNNITDISPLAGLTNLETLDLDRNAISDISAVAGLTNLTFLDIWGTPISDISPVAGLTNLTTLGLGHNNISDISPVASLTDLIGLYLPSNHITDISSVSGLTNLKTLWLQNNWISDLSPLVANTGLGSGDTVDIRGNRLNDQSLHTHIPALQSRGVTVEFDNRIPPPPINTNGMVQGDVPFANEPFDVNNIPEPVPPPKEVRDFFQLDPYYQQWVNVSGFPILASAEVSPYALKEVAWILGHMIEYRPDVLRVMVERTVRFSIIPHNKHASDMPESNTGRLSFFRDVRSRGIYCKGCPIVGAPEEELIGKFSTSIHGFGHLLQDWGLNGVDPTFDNQVRTLFYMAKAEGLYQGRYAGSDPAEYWAEGVASWFHDTQPKNVAHTRLALKKYDPRLAKLLTEVFGDGDWRYTQPATRTHLPHLQGFNPQEAPIYQRPTRLLELEAQLKDPTSDGGGKWVNLKLYDPSALSHLKKLTTGRNHTDLIFGNFTGTDLTLYTIDDNGKRDLRYYSTTDDLTAFDTHVGSIWLIQDHTGKDFAVFRAEKEVGRVLVTPTLRLITPGLSIVSGDNQSGIPGTVLASPFVVEVRDQNLSTLEGISVTFTITAGDGTLSVTHTTTDGNGRAESILTLGSNFGTNTVSALGIEGTVTFNAAAEPPVNIPNPYLRAEVLTTLGKPKNDPITPSEMATLTELRAPNANISDLTGLEHATDLTTLNLGHVRVGAEGRPINSNSLSNISLLAGLTNLIELRLGHNLIENISPLAGLTNLTFLDLTSNSVSNILPIASLTKLTHLDLDGNTLSDISAVAGLTNLTFLDIWGTPLSDISPVAGLTNLTLLGLGGNNISDLSPVVANTGLGDGDRVVVIHNPLSYQSIHIHIPTLQSRGVTVEFDNQTHPALLKISGDNQKGASLAPLSQPFVVEAQDAKGSALTGISVTFAATVGGGTLSTTITRTDANGRAQSTLTLGPNLGTNTVSVSATGIQAPVTFHAISDTEAPLITADVNNDGSVNVLDLVVIASELGNAGTNLVVDVNGDGAVNVLDLILVASMFDGAAAAPSAQPQVPETLTAVEVQGWLTDARALEVRDPIMKRGFVVLEQLLLSLTPTETELLPNYPNPFNPETWIPYRLAEDAFVTLTIYDGNGQIIRTLNVGHRIASAYESRSKAIHWNGRNDVGEQVASGVYFYTLTAGDFSATRKMLILK